MSTKYWLVSNDLSSLRVYSLQDEQVSGLKKATRTKSLSISLEKYPSCLTTSFHSEDYYR